MNGRHNCLGSGNRANLTIGRAVRLAAMNVLGARSGELDASSFGHPGKISFCFAEDPPPAPWLPLHEQLGYEPGDTTVTADAGRGRPAARPAAERRRGGHPAHVRRRR